MLIAVTVSAIAIISVFLLSQPPPEKIPALETVISNTGNVVQILHNGGDPLQYSDFRVMLDSQQAELPPDSDMIWSSGETLTFYAPGVKNVQILYTQDGGSKYALMSAANFEGVSNSSTSLNIMAGAGDGGSISPSGAVAVVYGGSQMFSILPDSGYRIKDVKVDGDSVGQNSTYTFTMVTKSHAIYAEFEETPQFTIDATAGPNGMIAPPGLTLVDYGGNQSYIITPDTGYYVLDVAVDGVSNGSITYYPFTNVVANHTIAATFAINAPVANFTATPLTGGVPLTVTFTDLSTNTPTSWLWNFGDPVNTTSVEKNPTHIYSLPGNYSVELTATNDGGSNKTIRQGYIFTYYPAVANFTGTPTSGSYGLSGLTVQFSDQSTGGVSSWNWSFGDGYYSEYNTHQNPGHTYAIGRYSVKLTVNNTFSSDYLLRENYINVTPNPPTSDFETYDNEVDMNPLDSGVAPLSVFFYDLCSDDPTSWIWNFSDGNVTTITRDESHEFADIYHTFTSPGTYNVSLTANNAWGSDTSYHQITVFAAPTVTGVSPAAGPTTGSITVTIIGTNLVGASGATFGGTPATSVSVINATAVSAITPAHAAGSVNVLVTTPNGTATGTNVYKYVSPPTITGISPTLGPLDGGTAVTITGTNLADATVLFGSNPATVTTPGTTSIVVTSPAGSAAGAVTVTVTTPGGSATTTYRYYDIQVFTSSTTWTVPSNVGTAEYLVVAGGGGGGYNGGAGGGAGGYLHGTMTVIPGNNLGVFVGNGGIGGTSTSSRGGSGANSAFANTTPTNGINAIGGGGGAGPGSTAVAGLLGGSGGGSTRSAAAGSGTAGQGNNGGVGIRSGTTAYSGGGGGGASQTGSGSSSSSIAGAGGAGSSSESALLIEANAGEDVSGTRYLAGGGGGGVRSGTIGSGGNGGGGDGASGYTNGIAGTANTGGGGGGGGRTSNGGAGGSGVVIIKYY